MCRGLAALPSSCLEKAKGMRMKLSHLAEKQEWTHHRHQWIHHRHHKSQEDKVLQDLESLLNNEGGLQVFRGFLRSEFSEENLEFWLACEDYRVTPSHLQSAKASSIYSQFIQPDAPQEVNLDAETRETLLSMMDSLAVDSFNEAQQRIYSLMAKDSFPRFQRSSYCMEATKA